MDTTSASAAPEDPFLYMGAPAAPDTPPEAPEAVGSPAPEEQDPFSAPAPSSSGSAEEEPPAPLDPAHLPGLFEDARFKQLGHEERIQTANKAIEATRLWAEQNDPHWGTPEAYRSWRGMAERARSHLTQEGMIGFTTRKAGDLVSGAGHFLGDVGAAGKALISEFTSPATAFLAGPIAAGAAGKAHISEFTTPFTKDTDAIASAVVNNAVGWKNLPLNLKDNYLQPSGYKLRAKLGELKTYLDSGAHQGSDPADFSAKMQAHFDAIAAARDSRNGAESGFAERVHNDNALNHPETLAALARYVSSGGDEEAWGAFTGRITKTARQSALEDDLKRAASSEGARHIDQQWGAGTYERAAGIFDPALFIGAGEAAAIGRAAVKTTATQALLKSVAKTSAAATAFALKSNPDAGLSEIGDTALQFLALHAAMHGGGKAYKQLKTLRSKAEEAPAPSAPSTTPAPEAPITEPPTAPEPIPTAPEPIPAAPPTPTAAEPIPAPPPELQITPVVKKSFTTAEPPLDPFAPEPHEPAPAPPPSPATPPTSEPGSMANAQVEARFKIYGLPEPAATSTRPHALVRGEAASRMKDPGYAPGRLRQLETDPTQTYTDTDTFVMQDYERQLLQSKPEGWLDEIKRIGDINRKGGADAARAMRARQSTGTAFPDELPPLSSILADAENAKGAALTAPEQRALIELADKPLGKEAETIARLTAELESLKKGRTYNPVVSIGIAAKAKPRGAKVKDFIARSKSLRYMLEEGNTTFTPAEKTAPAPKARREARSPAEQRAHDYATESADAIVSDLRHGGTAIEHLEAKKLQPPPADWKRLGEWNWLETAPPGSELRKYLDKKVFSESGQSLHEAAADIGMEEHLVGERLLSEHASESTARQQAYEHAYQQALEAEKANEADPFRHATEADAASTATTSGEAGTHHALDLGPLPPEVSARAATGLRAMEKVFGIKLPAEGLPTDLITAIKKDGAGQFLREGKIRLSDYLTESTAVHETAHWLDYMFLEKSKNYFSSVRPSTPEFKACMEKIRSTGAYKARAKLAANPSLMKGWLPEWRKSIKAAMEPIEDFPRAVEQIVAHYGELPKENFGVLGKYLRLTPEEINDIFPHVRRVLEQVDSGRASEASGRGGIESRSEPTRGSAEGSARSVDGASSSDVRGASAPVKPPAQRATFKPYTEPRLYSDPFLAMSAARALRTVARDCKTIAEFAVRTVKKFGDWIKPHIQALWQQAKTATEEALMKYLQKLGAMHFATDPFTSGPAKARPIDVKAYGEYAAGHLLEGKTPAEVREMFRKEFNGRTEPHWDAILDSANVIAEDVLAKDAYEHSAQKIIDESTAPTDGTIDRSTAAALAQAHLREAFEQGIHPTEAELTTQVKSSLDQIHGRDLDTREVREAWTDYGRQHAPDPAEIKKYFRDVRAQASERVKLQRLEEKLELLKSGGQRDAPSAETRRLRQEVADLKRKLGYQPINTETQLASARSAVISALKNQIETTEKVINGLLPYREQVRGVFKDDPAITALRKELSDLKAEAKALNEPKTSDTVEAAAVRAAERAAESYARRSALQDFGPRLKKQGPVSAALDEALAAREAARDAYQKLNQADPRTRAAKLQSAMDQLDQRIAEATEQLATGRSTKPTAGTRPIVPELESRVRRLSELRRQLAADPAMRSAKTLQALTNAIERERDIASGSVSGTPGLPEIPDTPAITAARETLRALRDVRAQTPVEISRREAAYQKARAKALAKQADLITAQEREVARGKIPERIAKVKRELDAANTRALDELNARKKALKKAIEHLELKYAPDWVKTLNSVQLIRRAYILMGYTIIGKLTAAAATRILLTLPHEIIGGVWSKLLPDIAKHAPREGGLSFEDMRTAAGKAVESTKRNFARVLKTGENDLQSAYGEAGGHSMAESGFQNPMVKTAERLIQYPTNLHPALKLPAFTFEFHLSEAKRIRAERAAGRDPSSDPALLTKIRQAALEDAERAIFQNKNVISEWWNAGVNMLDSSKNFPMLGKALARILRTELPIVKVPTNIVLDTAFNTALGLPTGGVRLLFNKAIGRDLKNLPPAEAEAVMRHLKHGSVGALAITYFFLHPQNAGGFYQEHEKRKVGDVPPDTIRIGDTDLPHAATHAPIFDTMQFAATVARVMHAKAKHGGEKGLGEGIGAAAHGLYEKVPFVRTFADEGRALTDPAARGRWVTSHIMPQFVSELARDTDRDRVLSFDHPNRRKAETFTDGIKLSLPGYRKTLPMAKAH